MTTTEKHGLIARQNMASDEIQAAKELAAVCNTYENLELKLEFEASTPATGDETNNFLYYESERLVGYCGIDYGELCGMVHPNHRRRGIGGALLDAVIGECKRRGTQELLVICERASRSGQGFVDRMGVTFSFAEHHMELLTSPEWSAATHVDSSLHIVRVGSEELDLLTKLTIASFGGFEESTRQRIAHDMENPAERFYIAYLEDIPISMLKVIDTDNKAGIYAFSVLPEYRGRGYGKHVLTSTIKSLGDEGHNRFALEVETNNHNAIRLYKSCGFEEITTYEYFKLRT